MCVRGAGELRETGCCRRIRDRSASRRGVRIGGASDWRIGDRTPGDSAVGRRQRGRSLKLEELEVKRLRVGELVISDSLVTPSDDRTGR